MAIQLLHVSDIHFGSGESHGRVNPATGLNIRFEDFVKALTTTVDYAVEHDIDLFLFSGDAYKNASPEPVYQKFFARELKRLSDRGIQTVLVVGNHDQILRSTSSHAMSVFQSLAVPGVITIDTPQFTRIATKNGILQLIGLPHVTRHQLLTLEKYADLSSAALDRVLVDHVTSILRSYYDQLDPREPSVVTAHAAVDTALAGIEQELLIGYTLTFPADIFVDPRIDYVALGHIHKHQVVRAANPAIVYAGSLERVDFGEEREDKGFIHARIARGNTHYEFHTINPRPFVTVEADLVSAEAPMAVLAAKMADSVVPGAVMRIRYRINQDRLHEIDEDAIRKLCTSALSLKFQPEVIAPQTRGRIPQLTESSAVSPMVALETYLAEVAPERKERLLERVRQLIVEDGEQCQ